jgi:hypothetical protein
MTSSLQGTCLITRFPLEWLSLSLSPSRRFRKSLSARQLQIEGDSQPAAVAFAELARIAPFLQFRAGATGKVFMDQNMFAARATDLIRTLGEKILEGR